MLRIDQHGDDFGHGTACAAIVRKAAPACELLAVKTSSGTDTIPPKLLVGGIDWAIRHGADVINVSAGTCDTAELGALTEVCRRAVESGIAVLAAEQQDGPPAYPAALDGVLAVGAETTRPQSYTYACDLATPGRFLAYGGYQKVAWTEPRFVFLSGSSFAAARLSGIVALIAQKFGRIAHRRLLDVLRHNAVNAAHAPRLPDAARTVSYPSPRSIQCRRAAIYPCSKEMHSLIRFRDLLPFEIVGVADPIAKGLVGNESASSSGGTG